MGWGRRSLGDDVPLGGTWSPEGAHAGVDWQHDPFGIIDLLNLKLVIHMVVDNAGVDVWIGLWMSVENLWALG